MLRRVEFAWRWLVTAFSYLVFGLGGLLFTVFVVPILLCLPGGELARSRRAQWILHRLLRAYVRMMRIIGVLTYQIEGSEKLPGARLILANFFTRGPIRAAGYIMNEEAADVIGAAARAMDAGQSLIIFPEGTRTNPFGDLKFRRGAANVAIRTGSAITPVLIYCAPPGLTKAQRWYQVPEKRMHFRFLVMDEYSIDPHLQDPRPSRAARNLSADLMNYFNEELETHG